MKVVRGINPDFADFDEIDQDALDIIESYGQGLVTFEELALLVGPEQAVFMRIKMYGEQEDDEETILALDEIFSTDE